MGLAYFFEGKFDETAAKLLLSIQRRSRLSYLVLRYGHIGRLDEARAIVARLRAITPRNRSERSTLSEHRALRAVPVGFALGGRRDGNKPEERVSELSGFGNHRQARYGPVGRAG